jgi:enamine deaminase RidA (YjgF/YER057c/UK114 family)
MNHRVSFGNMKKITASCVLAIAASSGAHAADVVRYSLGPNNNFPIARAVEVPAGKTIIFHSGMTPAPLDPKATVGSPEYWGDTKTQAMSAFGRIKESIASMGLGFGDVVAMTVYLGGDPAKGGRMDFEGFMAAYTQFFGTKEQPNLPARSTVQVAGLVAPGMLVEIEVQLVK